MGLVIYNIKIVKGGEYVREFYLRLPGPTEIPEEVLLKMARPIIGHRTNEFQQLFLAVTEETKKVFKTKNDVLIFLGSGTGGMEAAVVNLFSPGDTILLISIGVFGDRFGEIAESFGLNVEKLCFPWGKTYDPEIVKKAIYNDKEGKIKGVLVTHNETSTGVLNDLVPIKEILKDHQEILLVVDAISSLGAIDLKTDELGIDVAITSSQKALMIPPGLTLISVSDKAWEAVEKSKTNKFYWDFKKASANLKKGSTPYTPAVSLIFGLRESMKLIHKEGLENVFERHILLSRAFREGIKAMGLTLFADEQYASPTVTSVRMPDAVDPSKLRKVLENEYRVFVAGGQQKLKDTIIRVGHMGYIDKFDIINTLWALGMSLDKLGCEVDTLSGIDKAQEVFKEV